MMDANGCGDVFLLVSGSTDDLELLIDQDHLHTVMSHMPRLIGMNFLREPVISVATNNPGLEGYVPVDMSNITVSTYTEAPRVLVCIHSCQPFETEVILDFVRDAFRCNTIRSLLVKEAQFEHGLGVRPSLREHPVVV